MSKKIKGIIWLIVIVLLTAGCSQTSNFGQSVQEFFGFNRPTATPVPAPANPSASQNQQAQNAAQPEADPFGTSQSGGSSMANLGWDDLDPALIEPEDPGTGTKSSGEDNWEDDPYAYSFSPSSFSDEAAETQEKRGGPDGVGANNLPPMNFDQVPSFQSPDGQNYPQPQRPEPVPNNPPADRPDNNWPSMTFYPIRQNPVFRPMCELPRTGFPTGITTTIKESVAYAKTSMSISIPTLNVEENIVIVPLVDDNFPVEGLGENIGLLEGSGPGKDDLFVLAAHNHLNNQDQGPFVKLSAMKESDLIFISGANNSSRTFVVYANEKFASDDIDGLASFVKPGCMILITCEDESIEGGYLNRRVVFAEAKEE